MTMILIASAALALTPVEISQPTIPEDQLVHLICDEGKHKGTAVRVSDRLIVTAAHVARSETCFADDTKQKTAKVVYKSSELDFAMLELYDEKAPRWKVSCQDNHFGESYRAYGFARGVYTEVKLTGSGIRIGLGSWSPSLFFGDKQVIPGMSGGPIFDAENNLVGIVTNYDKVGNSYGRMMRDTNICAG